MSTGSVPDVVSSTGGSGCGCEGRLRVGRLLRVRSVWCRRGHRSAVDSGRRRSSTAETATTVLEPRVFRWRLELLTFAVHSPTRTTVARLAAKHEAGENDEHRDDYPREYPISHGCSSGWTRSRDAHRLRLPAVESGHGDVLAADGQVACRARRCRAHRGDARRLSRSPARMRSLAEGTRRPGGRSDRMWRGPPSPGRRSVLGWR